MGCGGSVVGSGGGVVGVVVGGAVLVEAACRACRGVDRRRREH